MTRAIPHSARLGTFILVALALALSASAQQQQATPAQRQTAADPTGAAQDHHWPVAVRWWGQAFVTIETWWGLTVAIDPYAADIGYDDPNVSADLVLITHDHADHNNPGLVKGSTGVVRGLKDGNVVETTVVLDRRANEEKPRIGDKQGIGELSPHAITATSIASFHDDQQGAQRGQNAMWLVEADGVRILHMGDFGQKQLTSEQLAAIGKIDVLLIPVGGVYTVDGPGAAAIVEQVKPRMVVPIHYKTDKLNIELQPADAFVTALPQSYERVQSKGNTLAASAAGAAANGGGQKLVALDYRPWAMPAELAAQFEKKEAAQQKSRDVFASLSAGQMNFKPSNGTHTPRWNVEHMNGYALAMFSGFYNTVDAEVAVVQERPEQMPPDYVPGHPTWTGAEEARQIDRTRAFARRFAYLLDGKGLDATVEGVRLPLGRVFDIQERHYNEHTGNVVKKFDLPDWPAK